ncbi:lysylphosphatidylglycerol synthase domain-containing protein [Viridibacterium curvum]|uniref:Lysylphosphatidylglycerol synthase transmembrane domain-containing protein n=1 Tax=Viridibacterium curvum TaxID=1101404 RepID=A0ABP9QE71_9RHOO
MTLSTTLKRLFALLCSAALIAWFVLGGDREAQLAALGQRLARIDGLQLAGLIAAFAATYLLRAGRIFDEFSHFAAPPTQPLRADPPAEGAGKVLGRPGDFSAGHVRFASILRLSLIHNAMVNVLPFRSGEATFPILLNRWFGVPTARAIAALLWLRLQDAFVVLALAALVWPDLPAALRAMWIAAVLLAAWGIPHWARNHDALLDQASHSKFGRLVTKFRSALAESTHGAGRSWLWTLANWSLKLVAQAWALSLLLGASLQSGLAGAMGVELAAILPIQGVAGFGTYEAGGAALLRTHGIMLADGLQACLILHLFVIACALSAGALAAVLLPGQSPASSSTTENTHA